MRDELVLWVHNRFAGLISAPGAAPPTHDMPLLSGGQVVCVLPYARAWLLFNVHSHDPTGKRKAIAVPWSGLFYRTYSSTCAMARSFVTVGKPFFFFLPTQSLCMFRVHCSVVFPSSLPRICCAGGYTAEHGGFIFFFPIMAGKLYQFV